MYKGDDLNLCDNMLLIQLAISKKYARFDTWLKESWLFSFITPTHSLARGIADEYGEPLHYEEFSSKTANRASKCYLALLSPLIALVIGNFFIVFFYLVFYDNTVLFFREYLKLLASIPLFLLLFLFVIPFTFFKLWFNGEKKHIQVYTYGLMLALLLPTMLVPRVYHAYYGESIVIRTTVSKVSTSYKTKWNSLVFVSKEEGLSKMDFDHLSADLVNSTHVGDIFMIHGKKSRFYFTYDELERL